MLPEVMTCKRCDSTDLKTELQLPCEDNLTNEEVLRDVVMCLECECIHYINIRNTFCWEFHSKPVDYKKFLMSDASDYAVILSKKSVSIN